MQAMLQDLIVRPVLRDADIIVPGILFWFAVQFATQFLAPRLLGKRFHAMPAVDRAEFPIRVCSIINGALCFRMAYLYLAESHKYRESFYDVMPGYREPLALLISYFMWDVVVCIAYGWGPAFTGHGIASCIGFLLCAYPCSDGWSAYYSGMFEMSNMFYHISTMLTALKVLPGLALANNVVFVILFFLIRIIGGTLATVQWSTAALDAIAQDKVHSAVAVYGMMVLIWGIMGLQYFWSTTIIKAIKDMVTGAPDKATKKE